MANIEKQTTESKPPANPSGKPRDPRELRTRIAQRIGQRDQMRKQVTSLKKRVEQIHQFLEIAPKVERAIQTLSEQLFEKDLKVLEEKLTQAMQEVLEQPLQFKCRSKFKSNANVLEFLLERNGNEEDILRAQGGSVHNVLSVGLRMFALARLDEENHQRFLVLDEQDCWLRPELVPKLVKIVHLAARELNFQVLMISHHDIGLFEKYADKIYRLEPDGQEVRANEIYAMPAIQDESSE